MSALVHTTHSTFGLASVMQVMEWSRQGEDGVCHSYNGQYQQSSPTTPQQRQKARLPPVATMVPCAGSGALPNRDTHFTERHGYCGQHATPSPLGRAPPSLALHGDAQPQPRRAVDTRPSSPHLSTATDGSPDRSAHDTGVRPRGTLHDNTPSRPTPRPYTPQSSQSPQNPPARPPVLFPRPAFPLKDPLQVYTTSTPAAYHPRPGTSSPSSLSQSPRRPYSAVSPKQEAKPLSISNLLSPEPDSKAKAPMRAPLPSTEYRITVRQQPLGARSCGFGDRDRRVIDPPPIVQLSVHDPLLGPDALNRKLRHPFSIVHCTLWDESGTRDVSAMPEMYRRQQRLVGALVASPFVGRDENGDEGCFFCFPDLSCRTPGTYRLRFSLTVIDPTNQFIGQRSPIVAVALSEPFNVYMAKDFHGMQASTLLARRLKEQGCLISIKKGNEKRSERNRGDDSSDEEEDEEDGNRRAHKKKKQKRA